MNTPVTTVPIDASSNFLPKFRSVQVESLKIIELSTRGQDPKALFKSSWLIVDNLLHYAHMKLLETIYYWRRIRIPDEQRESFQQDHSLFVQQSMDNFSQTTNRPAAVSLFLKNMAGLRHSAAKVVSSYNRGTLDT